MANPLIVPYDESMKLGQGFNSFLQETCVERAVDARSALTDAAQIVASGSGVAQSVIYSSRFVEKVSDVVRGMNISAGASIKAGTVETAGNSLTLDESKFNSSDLNAVISVKVSDTGRRKHGSDLSRWSTVSVGA